MNIKLIKQTRYESVEGLVMYIGTVPDRTISSGICYVFTCLNGCTSYVRPADLEEFLRGSNEQEDDTMRIL